MKNKIIVLGRSQKFIKILKSIYKKHKIQIISWININAIKKKTINKKAKYYFCLWL